MKWILLCHIPYSWASLSWDAVFNIILPLTLKLLVFEHTSMLGKERKERGGRTYKHMFRDLKWTFDKICILKEWWGLGKETCLVIAAGKTSHQHLLPLLVLFQHWVTKSYSEKIPLFFLTLFLADKHVKIDVSRSRSRFPGWLPSNQQDHMWELTW